MEKTKLRQVICSKQAFKIMFLLSKKLRKLYSKIRFLMHRHPRPRVVIRRLRKLNSARRSKEESHHRNSGIRSNSMLHASSSTIINNPIRIATFNAALFAVAPVVPDNYQIKSSNSHPKSILKNSPLHSSLITLEQNNNNNNYSKSKLRVSINLPENEISLSKSQLLSPLEFEDSASSSHWNNAPVRSPLCFPWAAIEGEESLYLGIQTIWDVLKEVDADIIALQDVKADEEKNMKPLSDLADALGMTFVFGGSWAPEYGNAILSKWPIKKWRVQRILNDEDIRNVLKATIDVPRTGEVNVYCTQLDYLNEEWRMKQINAIIESNEGPHILVGGLNSLDRSDYSLGRWTDIVKYFEDIGKPKPKDEVMKFLKGRGYNDAKDCAGDCEPVVIIAKGQNVQGTCKYGTRVDYILSSPNAPYKFLPGSYSVVSSKGTSDHHIVKVDMIKDNDTSFQENLVGAYRRSKLKVIRKISDPCSSRIFRGMER